MSSDPCMTLAKELHAAKQRFDNAAAAANYVALKIEGDRIVGIARELSRSEPSSVAHIPTGSTPTKRRFT